MDEKIKGGYYIKARKIQESEIAHAPPHVREIWDWLIKEANHEDGKYQGILIKRGQCIRSYKDILDGLSWRVGWRKMRYSKHQCEISMKWLKNATMITTKKLIHGMLITILNYDYYQNPKNYESHTGSHKKATRKPQTSDTKQEEEELKKEKRKYKDYVFLTQKEHERLVKDFGTTFVERMIWELDNYIGIAPKKRAKKYEDHNRVLRGWVLEKLEKKHGQKINSGNDESAFKRFFGDDKPGNG